MIRIYEGVRDNKLGIRLHLLAKAEPIEGAKLSDDILSIGWFEYGEIEKMYKGNLIRPGVFHETEIRDFLDRKPQDGSIVILEM